MKSNIKIFIVLLAVGLSVMSCGDSANHEHGVNEESKHEEHDEENEGKVHLSEQQFQSLGMKTDTLPLRNISSYVSGNGHLAVPPQNAAAVTAII